jgi:sugar/nucleoside kinase (ribokinase family)
MTKGGESRVPAFEVKTIDTTGAGDAYDAGFVVGPLRGWDLEQTSRFANMVTALKTTKKDARCGLPRLREVEKFMRNDRV